MPYKVVFYFTLLLSVSFCFKNVFAQQELPAILHYENSSGEKGISYFEYDGNHRIIKGSWQLLDKSRSSTNYYLYNKRGQLTEKYREFSDSTTSCVKYEYNKKGWKIVEIFWRSDGVSGKSVFEYNKKGTPIKIHCNKYNGWFDGEIIFIPGKKGKPKTGEIFRNEKKLGYIEFEYSEKGNLKKEKWITPNWNQTFEWEFISMSALYTSSNVFIKENNCYRLMGEDYSDNKETGGPSYFEYDKNGKLIKKTFVRSDSVKTITTYKYNINGILKNSFRQYNDGATATFTYKFNKNRKLESRHFKHSNGTTGNEKYFYDHYGQLKKAIWNNFDGWITGEITFEHARNGTLKSGKFTGEDFDATLDFGYDSFGNLISIVWNFSSGKTQMYNLRYQDFCK